MLNKMYESIHFKYDVTLYVPVYQINPGDKDYTGYPTFEFSVSDASNDYQFVASLTPDYVLELTGKFNATTKPFFPPDVYDLHGNGD